MQTPKQWQTTTTDWSNWNLLFLADLRVLIQNSMETAASFDTLKKSVQQLASDHQLRC